MPHRAAANALNRQALQARSSLVRLLVEVTQKCDECESVIELLACVLERVCEYQGWYGAAGFARVEEPPAPLRCVARYLRADVDPEALGGDPVREPWPPGLEDRVMREGRLVVVEERAVRGAGRSPGDGRAYSITVPMRVEEFNLGAVRFYAATDPLLTEDMEQVLDCIGRQLAQVAERRRLLDEAARAATAERERIVQMIHDTACQELAGLGLCADRLHRRLVDADAPEAEDAQYIADSARVALSGLRAALVGLRPPGFETGTIAELLRELATTVERRYQVRCSAACDVVVNDRHTAAELYYVASEAATNAARHARCGEIRIELAGAGPSTLRLTVSDNGSGMSQIPRHKGSFGFSVMKTRADALGGRLAITSAPGRGTTIRCEVPRHGVHFYDERPAAGAEDRVAEPAQGRGEALERDDCR